MCYCGCQFESYRYGPNEGCYCTKPRGCPCPEEVQDEEEIEYWNEQLLEDEERKYERD